MYTLLLASASPARRQTLQAAGINTQVAVSAVDEDEIRKKLFATSTPPPARPQIVGCTGSESATGIRASQEVQALAAAKATAIWQKLQAGKLSFPPTAHPEVILGCDSMLEMGGEILGKPHNPQLAHARLQAMSGNYGDLYTGHFLIDTATGKSAAAVSCARVYICELSEAEISAYVQTGEPLEVAGSFTIDGYGGAFVEKISGDPHGVVGVSLPLLRQLLAQLGYQIADFWKPNTCQK